MHNLSKSRYVQFCQCPKALWLRLNKADVAVEDDKAQSRIETGIEVGNLAKKYFEGTKDATVLYPNTDNINIEAMKKRTLEFIATGVSVIAEAAFEYEGCYCAVDLLVREGTLGFSIYEVKSTTHIEQEHIVDVAYQKYVLEHCGINIVSTHLLCLNSGYVRGEELDIQELFSDNYIDGLVDEVLPDVEANIKRAKQLIAEQDEPNIPIDKQCQKAGACPFWNYCAKDLPQPNVFNIGEGMYFSAELALMKQGIVSFRQAYDAQCLKPKFQKVVEANLFKKEFLDKNAVSDFLATMRYPLYHLDFETMQPAIPLFEGTSPYQQIPFQYSLHIQYEPCGPVEHKEFLAVSGENPLRAIAESLVNNIPFDACSMAYNMTFEQTRLKELAELFPDLAEHLLSIRNNMVDLMIPFRNMDYYTDAMQGSYSIKYVLPALFPNDPELDYHSLEDVHNGGEAMTIFPKIQFMAPDEQKRVRANLLKYCCLDTYAMVKVLGKLYEVVK